MKMTRGEDPHKDLKMIKVSLVEKKR